MQLTEPVIIKEATNYVVKLWNNNTVLLIFFQHVTFWDVLQYKLPSLPFN